MGEKMNELTRQETPTQKMARYLAADSVKAQFANVLKESAGSFMASIIESYNDKSLSACDPALVIMEAMKAASLKLPLNKNLGYGYIIPFKNVPTFIIGYKGLTQLALRTGYYKNINTGYIYQDQIQHEDHITGELIVDRNPDTTKPIMGYFAYIELINGFRKTIWMKKDEVVSHAKKHSKNYGRENSIWATDFDSMARKTVLRRMLTHWGYLSIEMATALEYNEAEDVYERPAEPNSIPLPEPKKEIEVEPKTEDSPGF